MVRSQAESNGSELGNEAGCNRAVSALMGRSGGLQ